MKLHSYEILDDFKQIDTTNIVIPCFIIWERDASLKNAISIPLLNLQIEQIFDIIQFVVKSIRTDCELLQIGEFVKKELSNSNILLKSNIYYGDITSNNIQIIGDNNKAIQNSKIQTSNEIITNQ